MSIRTLIVDDEPLARERIRALLDRESDIEVVGECGDGLSAVASIQKLKPALVFLDVQMPGLDGFGVLDTIRPHEMPCTVFVTAHDRHALRAFDVHAVDYLLKPFDRKRFQESLRRARAQLERDATSDIGDRLRAVLDSIRKPDYIERLVVKSAGRVFFVHTDEVEWFEAAGNYVRVHVPGREHLIRETMNSLELKLNPSQFVRIHRSTIVNINQIQELEPLFHGDFTVLLRNGARLTLSRGFRERVQQQLGTSL